MRDSATREKRPARRRPAGRALAAAALLAAGVAAASGGGDGCVPQAPAGYRLSEYRAPTPCTLAGAEVVTTASLLRLIEAGTPVLVDVLPAPRRPAGLAAGAVWLPPERTSLPGSVWLPNTGLGTLPVEEERYLREQLARLTGGDRGRALVFFCERACWMSWNAARRAVQWGYTAVHWYPGGTDDWRDAGRALERVSPAPRHAGH